MNRTIVFRLPEDKMEAHPFRKPRLTLKLQETQPALECGAVASNMFRVGVTQHRGSKNLGPLITTSNRNKEPRIVVGGAILESGAVKFHALDLRRFY
mmetsp:Transcript_62502/g.148125  ORF Transcript_62502/g.148125 Transcript_62502/m.148125 type:complete len:97 (+) Transcript_62502:150-440(+)